MVACDSKNKEEKTVQKIKVVTSNWIGYAPLLYAYEKGELEQLNIELVVTNSLQSSILMYEKNSYDGICSTQKEIEYINNKYQKNIQINPIAIFNRSYGGDVILASTSKDILYSKKYEQIDIYLEKDGVNEILFEGFKKLKNWKVDFNVYNMNQYNIAKLELDSSKKIPKVLITYEPYATKLKQKGFHLIESTKNNKLLVFDFLSIKEGTLEKKEINRLQKIVNNSIEKLQSNPKEFYHEIKIYFEDVSYTEFHQSLNEIQLFTNKRKNNMVRLIKKEEVFSNIQYLEEQ